MKQLLILAILLLPSGCAFTQRLDALNEQIAQMNAKLDATIEEIKKTNAKLELANDEVKRTNAKLDESNRLLSGVEKATLRLSKLVPGK
jgi:outer membrane murein-binding lipoprotein Lpp